MKERLFFAGGRCTQVGRCEKSYVGNGAELREAEGDVSSQKDALDRKGLLACEADGEGRPS